MQEDEPLSLSPASRKAAFGTKLEQGWLFTLGPLGACTVMCTPESNQICKKTTLSGRSSQPIIGAGQVFSKSEREFVFTLCDAHGLFEDVVRAPNRVQLWNMLLELMGQPGMTSHPEACQCGFAASCQEACFRFSY